MSAPAKTPPPIKSRKPTGAVPWPFVLVEGPEKSGKTWLIAELSASPRVGPVYWFDLAEGSADEYGAVPGAQYEVIEHDGTWWDIDAQVDAVIAGGQAALDAGEPPWVIGFDSMTAEWWMLSALADEIARERYRRKQKREPGENVVISMDIWNRAKDRHRALMTKLLTAPCIVVATARGKWVAAIGEDGKPLEGVKEYKVEGERNLAYDATVWVRLSREEPPRIIGARSVHFGVRPGIDEPRPTGPDFCLDKLIFDVMKCDPRTAHARDLKPLSAGALTEEEREPEPTNDQSRAAGRQADRQNGNGARRGPQRPPQARPDDDAPPAPGEPTAASQGPQGAPSQPAEGEVPKPPPTPEQLERRAKTSVDGLLNALDRPRVDKVVKGIEKWGAGKLDASPHLTGDDRERLGLEPEEQVLVEDVIAYAVAYWNRWKRSPRAPLDAAGGSGEQASDAA